MLLLSLLAATWSTVAAEPAPVDSGRAGAEVTRPAGGEPGFGDRSDEELTALAADWDALDRHQRRALLTEMRLRMARRGARAGGGQEGVLHIRTERRYGRLIRQSDGRVIRIETQVVHVRPVGPEDGAPRRGFGVGFEQRVAHRRSSVVGGTESAVVRIRSAQAGEPLTGVLDALGPALRPEPLAPIYPVADGTR